MLYRNQELLERFLSARRICKSTRDNYRVSVKSFCELGGVPLEEAGREDLEEWFKSVDPRLEASSILIYAVCLRKIIEYAHLSRGVKRREARLMAAEVLDGVPMEDLRREAQRNDLDLDMLLTPNELGSLVRTAERPRTRALIVVAYESACRKGELISARLGDVRFGEAYSELRVKGKTGLRVLPLVRSVPLLERWLAVHPDPRPRAPLFATVWRGEVRRMGATNLNVILDYLCEKAGLRHLHPHQTRHTRLTELAAAGVGEYLLKSFAGWTPDSRMAAKYIRLSGRAHIPAILETEGITADMGRDRPGSIAEIHDVLDQVLMEVEA